MPATADRASVASYAQFPAELDRDWLGRVCHLSGADLAVIRRRTDPVTQLAVGALPDGTPVIISGGRDGTVRVWRLADGAPVGEPLSLPESVAGVTVHGNIIVTAAGVEIAVHQLALPPPIR
jgi:WD40 repeat protein